jgi:D-alanyl-D-alanine carboxypeptidase
MMNGRALALGLTDTRFASPSGLNDHGYSTARDLAAMTRWAYTSRTFASIVATKTYRLRMPGGHRVELRNLNNLLFDYRGALGVKTGFTSRSRWSLVAVAKRRGVRIVVVLLGDPSKPFEDGRKLLNWGFRAAKWSSAVPGGREDLAGPAAFEPWQREEVG